MQSHNTPLKMEEKDANLKRSEFKNECRFEIPNAHEYKIFAV
jgi:hypothetical protein